MKTIKTYKLKIASKNKKFLDNAQAFQNACNWLSKIVFDRKDTCNPNKLAKEFYATVREKFGLRSQLTCSLFRHVISTYRAMKSNKTWSLAIYKKLSVPMCWKRDFIVNKKGMKIWNNFITYKSRPLPEGKWCDSKLKLIGKDWYLCLVIETENPEPKTNGTIVGVDRGQKNILCAVDLKTNKTLYVRGGPLNHRRLCIRQTRANVASVGTRSAKKLLKRLSGREKAVTQEMMHVASKQLVAFAKSVDAMTIVMEDLTGVREIKKVHHKQRARNNRWPFWMLDFFTTYKAGTEGISTEYVSARNTSRGCPRCGHVSKSNRNGLVFRCVGCGFTDNADRNGAANVALRSLLQRQAVEERAMCQLAYSSDEGSLSKSATSLT